MQRNTVSRDWMICGVFGSVSLAAAAAIHLFAPGAGMWLRPLFWPMLALAFRVRARYAMATAFAVPLVSCALTGMPSPDVAMRLAVECAAVPALVGLFRLALKPARG